MKRITCGIALVLLALSSVNSQAQTNQQRGTVWGGLVGAAAGAIIGENNDEAGAGAAIGGVVGAIAGNVLGDANDRDLRGYYPTAPSRTGYPYQQPVYAQPSYLQGAVSPQDVIALTQSRVSDTVILTAIQNNGLQRNVEISDIVQMSQNGVSDTVIRAMQNGGVGPTYSTRQVARGPVYSTQIRVASPRIYSTYPPRPHHHCHGPRYVR